MKVKSDVFGLTIGGLISMIAIIIAFVINQPILAILFAAPLSGAFIGLYYSRRTK